MDIQHSGCLGLVIFTDAQGTLDIAAFENLAGLEKALVELSIFA